MTALKDRTQPEPEVLIEEARRRQRKRRAWVAGLAGLLAAVGIVVGITSGRGLGVRSTADGTGKRAGTAGHRILEGAERSWWRAACLDADQRRGQLPREARGSGRREQACRRSWLPPKLRDRDLGFTDRESLAPCPQAATGQSGERASGNQARPGGAECRHAVAHRRRVRTALPSRSASCSLMERRHGCRPRPVGARGESSTQSARTTTDLRP